MLQNIHAKFCRKKIVTVLPLVTKASEILKVTLNLCGVNHSDKKLYNTQLAALNMLSQRFEHSYISMPGKVSDLVGAKKEMKLKI